MKKSKKALIAALALACTVVPASAGVSAAVPPDSGVVSPNYVAISSTSVSLTKASGKLECYGKVIVASGYTCSMTAELQKYDGSWQPEKTWYPTGRTICVLDEKWDYDSNYVYRLKITYKAYNSSGACVDSVTKYSDQV